MRADGGGAFEPAKAALQVPNPDLQRGESLRADVIAQPMHILDRDSEVLGPDDAAITGINQLDHHRQPATDHFDATRQVVSNIQQPTDFARIGLGATQPKR